MRRAASGVLRHVSPFAGILSPHSFVRFNAVIAAALAANKAAEADETGELVMR
jgi:hypothetical protein